MRFFVYFEIVGLSKPFITNRTDVIFNFIMYSFDMSKHVRTALELLSTITWTSESFRTVNRVGMSCKVNFLSKWFLTQHTQVRLGPGMRENVIFSIEFNVARVIALITGVSSFHWPIGVLILYMRLQCSIVAKQFTTCFTWITITCVRIRQLN